VTPADGGRTMVLLATLDQINATLAATDGLQYVPDPDFDQDDALVITANDLGNFGAGGPLEGTGTVAIDIRALNDDPVVTVPASLTALENTPLNLAGFNVTDVDAGAAVITVVLRVDSRSDGGSPNGIVTVHPVAGGVDPADVNHVQNNGTSQVTLTATVAQISATISNPAGWTYTPPTDYGGIAADPRTEVLTVFADDGGATGDPDPPGDGTDTRSVTITVQAVNDAPVVDLSGVVMIPAAPLEDENVLITGISVSDRDAGDATINVSLTASSGRISVPLGIVDNVLNNNTSNVTLVGSLQKINDLLAGTVTYSPLQDFNGPVTIVVTANDLGNWPPPAAVGTATLSLTFQAVNDPPVIHLPAQQPFEVFEDIARLIAPLSVTDVDAGTAPIDVWLNVANGQLTISNTAGVTITSTGSDNLMLSGPIAAINTALATLTYLGNLNYNGPDALIITANDRGNSPGTPATAEETTATLPITVVALNDAPTIAFAPSLPNPLTVNEDVALSIHGVTVDDVDLNEPGGTGLITVTLAVGQGTLTVVPSGAATVTANASSSVQITGTLVDVNATLDGSGAGFAYQGNLHFNGSDLLTVTANDRGNWPAPPQITTATRPIVVVAVNDPPVVNVPGPQTIPEDTTLAIPSITISDPDVSEGTGPTAGRVRVTLSVQHGTVNVALNVAGGILISEVQGNGTPTVIITAPPGRINTTFAAVNGLTYAPTLNYNSFRTGDGLTAVPDILQVTVNDLGNWPPPAQETTRTVPITVTAVNDPPVLDLPGDQAMDEDQTLVVPFRQITVSDVDALDPPGSGLLRLELSVAHGTLTVRTNVFGGLSAGDIAGNGTGQVVLTAPASQINATLFALSGVTYRPTTNYNGTDVLRVDANDLGNTGATGAKTAAGSLTVTIAAVNDPPTLVAPATLTVNEDVLTPLPASTVTGFFVEDVDAHEGTGVVRISFAMFNGTVNVDPNISGGVGAASVSGNNTNLVLVTATPAQINATFAAGGFRYRGLPNFPGLAPSGTDQLVVTVTDSIDGVINHGKGGTVPARATVTVTVNQVNDPPVLTVGMPALFAEDTPVTLTMTLTDVEMGSGAIFDVAMTSAVGFFTVANVVPGVAITGNGTGMVTLSGTDQQIKAALEAANAVTFQGNQDFNGTGNLIVTIVDRGLNPTLPDDDMTVSQTVNFTITPVNDPPVVQLPVSLTVLEDNTLMLGNNTVRITDVDAGTGNIVVTLQVIHGRLTVRNDVPGGLTVDGIASNGTNRVVVTGTVAAIDATLANTTGLSYLPNLDFFGDDMLTVTADDRGFSGAGGPMVTTRSVPITVVAVNDPPRVANPIGQVNVLEDAPNRFIQLFPGVFADVDNSALNLSVTANSNPSLVAAEIVRSDDPNGPPCPPATVPNAQCTLLRLRFLPDQSGTSVISITASDGEFSATDTFTVFVTPVPDSPFVANPIPNLTVSVPQITPPGGNPVQVVNLAGVFDDPDIPFGDTLTLVYNDATDNTNRNLVTGTLVNQTLTLQFTGLAGQANLTVHAVDSTGRQVSDTFAVTVNAPPVARNDSATTRMNTPVNILVTANDTDADGTIDQGSITIVPGFGPLNGTVTVANGLVTYTPDANYWNRNHPRESGRPLETFRYTVRDNQGFVSNEATVSITVTWVAVFQNPFLGPDVNASGHVSPIDALALINYLNTNPSGELPEPPIPPDVPEMYYDVNGDGIVSAQDVLIVINYLNGLVGLSGGEGEASAASFVVPEQPLLAAAPLLAVADYSLTMGTPPVIDMGLRPASGGQPSSSAADDSWDWNTVVAGSSRDAEFALLARQSGSLADESLDDLLGDIASSVENARGISLAEDWVMSALL
jgi:hypothetical protein